METIKILVDLLVELQIAEQYSAATIIGTRLKEEIYKLSTKEPTNEIQPVQL